MKLRIHANTLRLRLSQREVAVLKNEGRLEERVDFAGGTPFVYSIERTDIGAIAASFEGNQIHLRVPNPVAIQWIDSNEVGLHADGVVIEKDFQCLHRNSPEDADSFPNPAA